MEYIRPNTEIVMKIDNKAVDVKWEENQTIKQLYEDLKKADIKIKMKRYSTNEQVGSLAKRYFSKDVYMTVNAGDIVLYNDSNLVVFYDKHRWSYTKLGHIQNLKEAELKKILSSKDVDITLSVKK